MMSHKVGINSITDIPTPGSDRQSLTLAASLIRMMLSFLPSCSTAYRLPLSRRIYNASFHEVKELGHSTKQSLSFNSCLFLHISTGRHLHSHRFQSSSGMTRSLKIITNLVSLELERVGSPFSSPGLPSTSDQNSHQKVHHRLETVLYCRLHSRGLVHGGISK